MEPIVRKGVSPLTCFKHRDDLGAGIDVSIHLE
jgi:hypothetical protein